MSMGDMRGGGSKFSCTYREVFLTKQLWMAVVRHVGKTQKTVVTLVVL